MLAQWKSIILFGLFAAVGVSILQLRLNAGDAEAQVSVQSAQIVLSPIKDNTLYEDESGSLSNGAGQLIIAGTEADGSIRRALLAFDVSSIPAGSTIDSVTLRLYVEYAESIAPVTIFVHKVIEEWGEGTSDAATDTEADGAAATPNDATWLHQFFDSDVWTTVGGAL